MSLHGYALVSRLQAEADDIARDDRAELVRDAAREIKRLLEEQRTLTDALRQIHQRSLCPCPSRVTDLSARCDVMADYARTALKGVGQ